MLGKAIRYDLEEVISIMEGSKVLTSSSQGGADSV
jgi:hypothetical protein